MKKPTLKSLKKKAWDLFSKYIRLKYSDRDGICECITCGAKMPWKEIQAGHFLDSRNNAILFEESGVHPQCYRCNICLKGNKVEYTLFMLKKYGRNVIDSLKYRKNQTVKYTIFDYEEMIDRFKSQIEYYEK